MQWLAVLGFLFALAAPWPAFAFDLSFCEEVIPVEDGGVPLGDLCVVKPSATDAGGAMLDVDPDCERDTPEGPCTAGNGYGNHVVAIPHAMAAETRVTLVISGAYGAPHSDIPQAHLGIPPGDVRYRETLADAMRSGLVAIQPAYRNPSSVNRDVCTPALLAQNPQCHFLIRTLVLEGAQRCPDVAPNCGELPSLYLSPEPGHALDVANAYLRRLDRLVAHLLAQPLPWPADLSPWAWERLRLVGHSQGAGHVYLLATLEHEVAHACYLAGPRDWDPLAQPNDYADWFRPYPLTTRTPKSAMQALVSESDAFRAIARAWVHVDLPAANFDVLQDVGDPGDGHEDIIASAGHSLERSIACFGAGPPVPLPRALSPALATAFAVLGWCSLRRRRAERPPS